MEKSSESILKEVFLFMLLFGIVDEVVPDLLIKDPHFKLIYKIVTKVILVIFVTMLVFNVYRKKEFDVQKSIPYILLIFLSLGAYIWFNLRGDF